MPITERTIIFSAPKELVLKLDRESKKKRLSRSGMIRLILSDWLEKYGEKKREPKPRNEYYIPQSIKSSNLPLLGLI